MKADGVEAVEILHAGGGEELHFRFIGSAANRFFVVNIQFGTRDEKEGGILQPEDYSSVMQTVLRLVLEQVQKAPNLARH